MRWHLICIRTKQQISNLEVRVITGGRSVFMTTLKEFSDFDSAAFAVLQCLHQRYGFGLWMITRVKEESWVVLSAEDQSFGVKAGDTFEWSDSICSRMVRDEGPRVAGRCDEIPAYVDAPIRSRFDINAYIGIPLQTSCGRFFGTLCAIDNVEHPELDDSELPLLELLSGLLAGYVRNELENNELERRNERFRFEAMTDALTHLPNRRAWEEKLGKEQQRSRRLGETTFISIIDLNELKEINDRKGHADGDEFAVLGIQCDSIEPDDVSDRLRASLQSVDISASVGTAVGRSSDTHCEVWHNADAAMYRDKKSDGRVGCR